MKLLIKSLLITAFLFIYLHSQNTNHNLQLNLTKKISSDVTSVIDSIVVNGNGNYKYQFVYDSTGNIISRLYEYWNSNFDKWLLAQRETNTYNLNRRLLKKVVESCSLNNDTWYKFERHTYKYDSLGNEVLYVRETSRNQVWKNDLRETRTYNSDSKITEYLLEYFIEPDSEWIRIRRTIFDYNVIGKLVSRHSEYWDDGWVENGERFSYNYNDDGKIKSRLTEMLIDSNSSEIELHNYTYDTNNNLISELVEKAPEWRDCPSCPVYYLPIEKYEKYLYSYDLNGNMILNLCYTWIDSSWIPNYKETYNYDLNNKETLYLSEKWTDNNWERNIRFTYTYNSNNNLIHFIGEQYKENSWTTSGTLVQFTDSFGNLLEFGASEITVYYSQLSGINETACSVSNYSLSQNYPNPFNPITSINYFLPKRGLVQLKVFDILGREIVTIINEQQSSGSHEVKFNASSLSSGMYFYRLKSGSFVGIRKFTIVK